MEMAFRCTCTPLSDVHSLIGTDARRTTAAIPSALNRLLRSKSFSCSPLGDGKTHSGPGAYSLASARVSRARADSGTRCSRRFFIHSDGIVHSAPWCDEFRGGQPAKSVHPVLRAIGGLDSSNPLVRQSPLGDRGGYGH